MLKKVVWDTVDTGGFSEASKAAMMDSDYFNKRKSSNPFSRGFNFYRIRYLN